MQGLCQGLRWPFRTWDSVWEERLISVCVCVTQQFRALLKIPESSGAERDPHSLPLPRLLRAEEVEGGGENSKTMEVRGRLR